MLAQTIFNKSNLVGTGGLDGPQLTINIIFHGFVQTKPNIFVKKLLYFCNGPSGTSVPTIVSLFFKRAADDRPYGVV